MLFYSDCVISHKVCARMNQILLQKNTTNAFKIDKEFIHFGDKNADTTITYLKLSFVVIGESYVKSV